MKIQSCSPPRPEAVVGATMPDLTGFSKRSLLPLLERKDVRVVINGNGYVVSQEPPPGSAVREGEKIVFTLK